MEVLQDLNMRWSKLTGQDGWPWQDSFKWSFYNAEGLGTLAENEAAEIDSVAENSQEELWTATKGREICPCSAGRCRSSQPSC